MTIQHRETNIFFTQKGQGETLVFLHGFLENLSMWRPFVDKLAETNHVVCIDLLGHGQTGCTGYIHSMEQMAEAVLAVVNHLKINSAYFVGHSMGGYVGLAFAELKPDMVLGLCLMNSTAEADAPERKLNRDRAILAVKDNHERFIKMAINNLFMPKNRTLFASEIKTIITEAIKTPLQGIIAALEGMKIRNDRQDILRNAKFKTLIVASENDPVLEFENLKLQAIKCNTPLVKFPDGHMSHIENKASLLNTIMHFIEKI